ncbi:hypothetical protein PC116_g27571 [Phytophthora cactorum]|uniref:Uncharacterized protein n=1 Tax=Phytophthora cactorum TaxID=29920 RepID=A0A8T1JPJ5_9STRA|nr:hypothetical protein Pcac1_g13064 [Phytophthora cactorum]KAG3056735.1 hypothetical protein PI125_g25508 [Phytophthora idaei]KAG2873292.1 hypothetical protein PC114_g25939 [Phytophthora cactorum]KAG2951579.1 hypothetical protein PC117_g3516 [Phytophthora cactorum]KAG2963325.1 hypothetical protein PC119_g25544 [Phytophthora cactorum]
MKSRLETFRIGKQSVLYSISLALPDQKSLSQ